MPVSDFAECRTVQALRLGPKVLAIKDKVGCVTKEVTKKYDQINFPFQSLTQFLSDSTPI